MRRNVPVFAGKRILTPEGKDGDANGAVIKELIEHGKLLAKGTLRHSYPHSWRSKAPVIFRATPQWFVGHRQADDSWTARRCAQLAHEGDRRNQMVSAARARTASARMVEGPARLGAVAPARLGRAAGDLRRQENRPGAERCRRSSSASNEAFEAEGADAWFNSPPSRFLGNDRNADDYEQVNDILDVWFDSGSTHVFTVEHPHRAALAAEATTPISIWKARTSIAAGSSPRCWKAVGTRGRAPYRRRADRTASCSTSRAARCPSRSATTLAPQAIAEKNGADILRLWAASSDFTEDLRIGQDIIKANVDAYRRLRNTIRFMLANLAGFDEKERIGHDEMPELERYHAGQAGRARWHRARGLCARSISTASTTTLFNFCTNDLSAFYFDIRKDVLYCDAQPSARRRAARTVMDEIFRRIVTWFAPILCFTMEEAWLRASGMDDSVHLQDFFAGAGRLGKIRR